MAIPSCLVREGTEKVSNLQVSNTTKDRRRCQLHQARARPITNNNSCSTICWKNRTVAVALVLAVDTAWDYYDYLRCCHCQSQSRGDPYFYREEASYVSHKKYNVKQFLSKKGKERKEMKKDLLYNSNRNKGIKQAKPLRDVFRCLFLSSVVVVVVSLDKA